METQSGNGEGVLSPVSSGIHSQGQRGAQVEKPEDPVLKEDLQAAKRIERFDIPLDSLKRMFEKSTETANVHASPSKRGTSRSIALPDQPRDKTVAFNLDDSFSAEQHGSRAQDADDRESSESVSLKERLAMYQAAVSHKESTSSPSATVMEESEACSLPGGLASVKKQFENQGFTSSSSQSSSTQYHFQQRTVQELSRSSEVTVRSNVREVTPSTSIFQNQQEVSHYDRVHHNNVAASHGSDYETGGEDLQKISTQALKQQYEKTIEEATPASEIKVNMDFNQFQWTPVGQLSKTSTVTSHKSSSSVKNMGSSTVSSVAHETSEDFPPPPMNLLDVPHETSESGTQSHKQVVQNKSNVSKEQYVKYKSMAELKRLYKHIHPEVRKNLEEDYLSHLAESEQTQEAVGDVQQTCFMFENEGSSRSTSPDRESVEWDEILRGEVQSRRWMFENKPLDTIKDDTPDENEVKNIAQQEIIAGKDVKYTAWMFETQPMDALGSETLTSSEQMQKVSDLARGDVRTATWLFETQPLDYLNKIYQEDEQDAAVSKDITGGDVKTARYLFETQHLDSLGKTETFEESNFLSLKSELEEVKGDVKTTTRRFETLPMCVIRGDSGEMLEITTIRREETEKGDVKTSRWMFETQPLDMINKDLAQVKLICGISMKDNIQGGVNKGRWLFETKTLDTIKDEEWEAVAKKKEEIIGADVRKHCLVFETQPMDTLKDNANARNLPLEEILGGDVQSARHLFETVPMENLKELNEVGKLKKMAASEEEKGDVRHQKWVFESQPLASIREEKKEMTRTVNIDAQDKGDVTNCKVKFESMDLSKCEGAQKILIEGVTSGSVESNRVLFESTPLYAMQDSSGHYHEVRTVRREEIVKGDVRSCRWMFETRPIDEFDDSLQKFQLIKGISKQEIESGDVKTAKWLFETQQLDAIKNVDTEETETKEEAKIERGDVKTCRWLFETQPMDVLYEKVEKSETNLQEVQKGDVKTCTWLFETQSLDNIRDHTESESETILKTCTVKQEDIQGKDVRLARFLFETENLENLTGEDSGSFRRVTEIDIQSGDVSRMKYIFENRSSDIMSSTSEETMQLLKTQQAEDIQKGNVVNCTWMFENNPIDSIHDESKEDRDMRTVTDVQGGDVHKGRFTFETFSLDQIKDDSTESDISKLTSICRNDLEKGDVKNYTMMFETQPLYAIRDKEGHYHEVTTVTKEEIMRGDVVGARWLFETKPLDSIRDSEEVYVIKAVTEEGVNKGDVSSARWRFETQPLDEITEEIKVISKTVADIQGGDVRTNKQRFETDEMSQKYIRTVSVSEIQKGDVRSATWMFETHAIDEIGGKGEEYDGMETVTKEEVMKGDVKQSVWLFEKQPLDSIKETDDAELVIEREEIPQGDVKTTTWLFETTPFHEFNETAVEKRDIVGKSIKETLEELYSQKMVDSKGILIEADEIGDVRMAKYKLMNQETPEIQREEIVRGDLANIMMNLLNRRENVERGITIDTEERGNINTTVEQLFNRETGSSVEKEEILRGDIREAINSLLRNESSSKRGILIQEDEKGDVRMTIYSLLNKGEKASTEKEDIVQGNVSKTLHRLLSNSGTEDAKKIKVGDIERGNVSFYTTCIESGALDYLKQLQRETDETAQPVEKECIIGGDVEETKILLRKNQQEIGRTVAKDDIVPGDVCSIVQVFMTEPKVTYRNLEKQDIVKGNLNAALDSLSQAINQKATIEKEEVVKGNLSTTLRSLEEAQYQPKEMEKPEIIPGDIRGALESLEKSATTKMEATVDDLVPGDIKGTLKSLEEAKHAVKEVVREEIVKGDIHVAMQNLHEASAERKTYQHQVSEQGDIKATIQLLLEPTTSPRMQRRGSTEGDVKTSIKSLYEGQETTFVEKEEVVKGDVQGAIKCLMQKKQYSKPKRLHSKAKAPQRSSITVNQVTLEEKQKNITGGSEIGEKKLSQSCESQKHNESKVVKTQVITNEASVTVSKTDSASGAFQQKGIAEEKPKVLPPQKTQSLKPLMIKTKQTSNYEQENAKTADANAIKVVRNVLQTNNSSRQKCDTKTVQQVQTTVVQQTVSHQQKVTTTEHAAKKEDKSLTQKQSFKNMKSESRNLDMMTSRGMIKKGKPEIHFPPPPSSPPPPSESELSLPPPPSPVLESSTPNLSRPPTAMQESDLPPPPTPPPLQSEPDFFPPPPPPTSCSGQDFLPPPPSQEELNAMPLPPAANPGKPFARSLFKFPKQPEAPKPSPVQPKWQKNMQTPLQRPTQLHLDKEKTSASLAEVKVLETIQSNTNIPTPPTKPVQKTSPQPPKKIFPPPIKLPQPPEPAPAPKPRPYARKFKTPLMLAEEKYRQQRMETEETAISSVTTPTSPPVTTKVPPGVDSLQLSMLNQTEKREATEVVKENVHVPKEPSLQHKSTKKIPSQIPLSKPLISVANKKVTPGVSDNSLDNQQLSSKISSGKLLSSKVSETNQATQAAQSFSLSQSEHATSHVQVQSSATTVTPPVTEKQQFIKTTRASNTAVTQSGLYQENIHIQGQTVATLKAEDVENLNDEVTKDVKTQSSQPTKIPKVMPSFKVRTFKMPAEKKEEKHNMEMKSETQLQQHASNVSQSSHVTSSMKDVQINETKNLAPVKSAEVAHSIEAKRTQPPAVTLLTSEKGKTTSVSQVQHSTRTQQVQRQQETVVTESSQIKEAGNMPQIRQEAAELPKKQTSGKSKSDLLIITSEKGKTTSVSKVQHSTRTQQVHKQQEMVVTESSQRKEAAHMPQIRQEAAELPKTQTSGKSKSDLLIKTTQSEEMPPLEKCHVMETLLTQMKVLEGTPNKIDPATVSMIISDLPDWLLGSNERKNLCGIAKQSNKKKLKEMLSYLKNITQVKHTNLEATLTSAEMKEFPPPPPPVAPKPDQKVLSGMTAKLSKISIGSSKTEKKMSEERKSLHEGRVQHELSETADQRVHSPLASIRTPSPTFISIESRRIESPLRGTPSPPPYRSFGTPPPPARKQYTATSSFRATPSPTMSRSEKTMQLKDTSLKPSCSPTPTPPLLVDVGERSSPVRQTTPTLKNDQVHVSEMGDSMMTVKDKKSFFEDAQKSEANKSYLRKDPIDIPERLEADFEEGAQVLTADILKEDLPRVDMTKLVNKFESPKTTVYSRKEPIVITERLGSDSEDVEAEPRTPRTEEMSTYNIKAIKNVFESGEHSSQAARDLREQIEKREADFSHAKPAEQSEASSFSEQFCSIDDFGNLRSEVHSGSSVSSVTRGNPPSYADVVRGRVPTVAVPSEELLRNFQQSWAESQGSFQNVGFSVTEQRSSQIVTRQQETVVMEDSSSGFRTVQGVSEEGVPYGISNSRQAKLP
ncbi:xin actin-binding repeat-containing protein 2 isoform X2 [Corythoichthys intestinalis]|uniref:xin actin-binding repeat-containing protein 2 isoform X2 n=1 Tax=Corythoichthys intestinalis TaxID=161448 RepID=UPI0025A64276|nr:xin actin-binding repeat-containing protein 2 isoform X2 [Corythoichthys intestinalis]